MSMEKWNKFTKTGSIYDYLEYTASEGEKEKDEKPDSSFRNSASGDADRGLRQESNDSYKGAR